MDDASAAGCFGPVEGAGSFAIKTRSGLSQALTHLTQVHDERQRRVSGGIEERRPPSEQIAQRQTDAGIVVDDERYQTFRSRAHTRGPAPV